MLEFGSKTNCGLFILLKGISCTDVNVKIQRLFEMVLFCQYLGLGMLSCTKCFPMSALAKPFTTSAGMIVSSIGIVAEQEFPLCNDLYFVCVLRKSVAKKKKESALTQKYCQLGKNTASFTIHH